MKLKVIATLIATVAVGVALTAILLLRVQRPLL